MRLSKLELSAILGVQARSRELVFVKQQIEAQTTQLEAESKELFTEIEERLNLEAGELENYNVDVETGELTVKNEEQLESEEGVANLGNVD